MRKTFTILSQRKKSTSGKISPADSEQVWIPRSENEPPKKQKKKFKKQSRERIWCSLPAVWVAARERVHRPSSHRSRASKERLRLRWSPSRSFLKDPSAAVSPIRDSKNFLKKLTL